jgi:hypothetical protein
MMHRDGYVHSNCSTTVNTLKNSGCSNYCAHKVKLKSLPGLFQHSDLFGSIVILPQQVPAFISRGATHHIDARDLYQRRRELHPYFASGSEFYKNSLGCFTRRKAGTWDILFYFPSEGRHTSAGFEPAYSGSSCQYSNH